MERMPPLENNKETIQGVLQYFKDDIKENFSTVNEGDIVQAEINIQLKEVRDTIKVEFTTTKGEFDAKLEAELKKQLSGLPETDVIGLNRDIQARREGDETFIGGYRHIK